MNTFAAIDIGSNAMRLAIGRFDKRGGLSIIATRRAPVRLGAEVFRSGRMSPRLMEEGVAAFLRFEALLRSHKVSVCRAVATSALRDAKNSADFVDRVRRATGIQIEIITGDEEARLIHGAVATAVPLKQGTSLLIDIGGGSVELTLINRGSIIFSESVNMGTVRLLEMVRGQKRSEADLLRLLGQYAERIRAQISRTKRVRSITRLIGTGGNIDTLGDLRRDILKKKNNKLAHRFELLRLMKLLQGMTVKERIEKLKLRPDRADVIMPAMALILGIIKETKVRTLLIPRTGLRDGVLLDLYQQERAIKDSSSIQRSLGQIRSYALELGRRYSFDETHAKHAVKLSLQVFDQLKSAHALGGEERALLEIAALLHDLGYFINSTDHHKHSEYIIRSGHFVGLSEHQRKMVALIARYHRGGLPSPKESDFATLSKRDQRVVRVLSGIIRLVEELDREHLQRISRVRISRRGARVALKLPLKTKLLVERIGAEARKEALEESLGITISIV
jgi:exopolyphosphatase/guanosine-5'-triphosphate,3'-diphosphate pyrophosphatase